MYYQNSDTSIVMSVSILGPGTKELINQGDFHAEGESIPFLNGVSPILWNTKTISTQTMKRNWQQYLKNVIASEICFYNTVKYIFSIKIQLDKFK